MCEEVVEAKRVEYVRSSESTKPIVNKCAVV
jgi:hypothetical protein